MTAGEITQADAARKWGVDVSTIIGTRPPSKTPPWRRYLVGRPGKERNWPLEAAQAEVAQLTEAVKAQAIELAIVRGEAGWD